MIKRSTVSLIAVAAAALVGLAGCGSDPAPPAAAPNQEAGASGHGGGHGGHGGGSATGELELWAVQTGPLGVVVTDGTGALVYRSDRDGNAPSNSSCTGDCTAVWEPLAADLNKPPVLLGVNEDQIGVLTRPDGRDQLTLAGWPLYRHLGTHADQATQANGTDGVWFAIRPDGQKAAPPGG
jgi:predicted lipoprotein with Yx(FWY)xxD motif